eukprot:Phypoly_transcript_23151.p1 GENE.Phypoly_transcript_23151~~Phypoly_transcript_23151.p1  ORF type:complete len:108 (+),score=25.93 Phypoly_transcript_23151:160-483(+)
MAGNSTLTSADMVYNGKPSVRLHHPPGGGSSNIFGAFEEPAKPKPTPVPQPAAAPAPAPAPAPTPAPASTPAPAAAPKQEQGSPPAAGVKTSVRIHNPPGGKSSITF